MKKKIIAIVVMTLLITTAISAVGMNTNIIGENHQIDDELSYKVPLSVIIPNDPDFIDQWALDNTGQTGGTPDCDIDAPEAWEIETGGDVVIAVIDSGIDYTHPELVNKIWTNEDEIPDNGIDDDNNGYIDDYHGYDIRNDDTDTLDEHCHGTLIAGVIAAETNNGIGIAGINWDCIIMPIKIWNTDAYTEVTPELIQEGIQYAADNDADIISMSLGGDVETLTEEGLALIKDAVDYAYSKGCILVAAAGNNDNSDPFYPAAFDNVLGVAGTDFNDQRMYQGTLKSNYGDWVDVAAPAEDVFTTSPTYDCVATQLGYDYDYNFVTGTSIATPHVSGLAALLISKNPTYPQEKIMDIIKANVDPYDSNYYLGTGRINAHKALTEFNVAPEKPDKPLGPAPGKPNIEYTFKTSTTDSDGDDVYYKWNWGDGNYSDWLDTGEGSHAWAVKGDYDIRVMAKDIYGAESEWSDPLTFTIPRNKAINRPILNLLQFHPSLFPLLQKIIRQLGQ